MTPSCPQRPFGETVGAALPLPVPLPLPTAPLREQPLSPSSRRPSLAPPPPGPGDPSGASAASPNPHDGAVGHKGGTIPQDPSGSEHLHSPSHPRPPAGHKAPLTGPIFSRNLHLPFPGRVPVTLRGGCGHSGDSRPHTRVLTDATHTRTHVCPLCPLLPPRRSRARPA